MNLSLEQRCEFCAPIAGSQLAPFGIELITVRSLLLKATDGSHNHSALILWGLWMHLT